MRRSYDPEVDALAIVFRETTVTTKHLAEGIAADYDRDGWLAGLTVPKAEPKRVITAHLDRKMKDKL